VARAALASGETAASLFRFLLEAFAFSPEELREWGNTNVVHMVCRTHFNEALFEPHHVHFVPLPCTINNLMGIIQRNNVNIVPSRYLAKS
jgi:hypothetical protein